MKKFSVVELNNKIHMYIHNNWEELDINRINIDYYKISNKYYMYTLDNWEAKEINKEAALQLEKLGVKIRTFEIWNEWNGYDYSKYNLDNSAGEYSDEK